MPQLAGVKFWIVYQDLDTSKYWRTMPESYPSKDDAVTEALKVSGTVKVERTAPGEKPVIVWS